jgi:serine phosphatase RsbU (regulator of sigma subunit)
MRKRPRESDGSDPTTVESLTRELSAVRAELEQRRRRDDERSRFDALSGALVGELDLETLRDRAERWAIAALGRPCTIVSDPPDAGSDNRTTIPLGVRAPIAWLHLGGTSLGPDDEGATRDVVERIGRALDAADRVSTQTQAMHRLERSLLPDALLPVPGIQLASRYLPAHGSHDVGGDFYDAIRTDSGVTLIVGDVQGKGIEAATLTSLARHTLRAGALNGHPPAELLGQLNTALLYGQDEQIAAGLDSVLRFVTAAAARLTPTTAGEGFDLTVARAGQPPPIIVRSDGQFEPLEPRGVLLGVCEKPEYEEATAHLAVGDTLVLYTDGVIEQRGGAGKALSEQHLGMLVRNRRGVVDAEAIAQLIEDTVHLVAPEDVRDDVAILVACATRVGAEVSSPSADAGLPAPVRG